MGDNLAAAGAGFGTEVANRVAVLDHFAVVLDHDHRVAKIAQAVKRLEQPRVVTRVQSDRRLVKHIKHATKTATKLTGQSDSLGFSVGKRSRGSVDRDVLEPNIVEEIDAADDLANQFAGDLFLTIVKLPLLQRLSQDAQRHAANSIDRDVAKTDRRSVVSQTGATAATTFDFADQRLHPLTKLRRQSRSLFHRRVDAFVLERKFDFAFGVCDFEPAVAGAVKHHPAVTGL